MLSPLVLDAQGCVFLLGIRWSGKCVPPRYYMLRDECSLIVIDARGCVVFLCIRFSDMCSLLLLHA